MRSLEVSGLAEIFGLGISAASLHDSWIGVLIFILLLLKLTFKLLTLPRIHHNWITIRINIFRDWFFNEFIALKFPKHSLELGKPPSKISF